MREKLLAKQWEIYRMLVIPENAHAIQVFRIAAGVLRWRRGSDACRARQPI